MSKELFIENTLSEHYRSYILLAYDYEGGHYVIKKINNQGDMDALSTAFKRESFEFEENGFPFIREDEDIENDIDGNDEKGGSGI